MIMPNGPSAMSTISIQEGRANRIADYTKHGLHTHEIGRKAAGSLKAQGARLRAGQLKRRRMAEAHLAGKGRWTHGVGDMGVGFGPYKTSAKSGESVRAGAKIRALSEKEIAKRNRKYAPKKKK
jgi:hypothetical protein